tara:strand:+ start:1116 stop:1262 length:147 start_codon:yes stop_codon:yes gene_type:complete
MRLILNSNNLNIKIYYYNVCGLIPQTKNPTRYFSVIKNISNNFGHVKT